ncbi:MAG: hypothetical protein ACI4DV_03710 [Lachnospiraceae bacterium]
MEQHHLNISVYKDGRNLFNSAEGSSDVRDEARWFMGGIMEHVDAMCAVTNPLVNSYKRPMSGFYAPKDKTWTCKNRNALLKVRKRSGEDTKIDLKFPDPSSNPYLAIAVCLAAGMDGIERKLDPGTELEKLCENSGEIGQLPGTLREAVVNLKNDSFMEKVLGKDFLEFYADAKMKEWDEYMDQVSMWEIDRYLYKI